MGCRGALMHTPKTWPGRAPDRALPQHPVPASADEVASEVAAVQQATAPLCPVRPSPRPAPACAGPWAGSLHAQAESMPGPVAGPQRHAGLTIQRWQGLQGSAAPPGHYACVPLTRAAACRAGEGGAGAGGNDALGQHPGLLAGGGGRRAGAHPGVRPAGVGARVKGFRVAR